MILILSIISCKKSNDISRDTSSLPIEIPTIKKDKYFPNGILQFNSKESLNSFYHKANTQAEFIPNLKMSNFKSFRSVVKNFERSTYARENPDEIPEVDTAEFIMDCNINLVEDNGLQDILNSDLQVIVDSKLYQETKIGFFTVNLDNLSEFMQLMTQYKDSILFNPNFTSIPGEIPLGDDKYLISEGIERTAPEPEPDNTLAQPVPDCDPTIDPDCPGYPGGGGGGTTTGNPTPCGELPTNFYYEPHTVNTSFTSSNSIFFDDRCFTFKTRNVNFFGLIHIIEIKAKLQRKKRFLFWYYWGPSYADEIIVGCDNMDLETDYIFPHPQQFSALTRPDFTGIANYSIGNNTLSVVGINVNQNILGYTLNNAQLTSFINHTYNSFIGNLYQNGFHYIENNILSAIDPSYPSQYASYTKMVNSLDDQYRLKFVIGKGERAQGYSHSNHWTFDWHVGFGEGNNINYTMKAGSFYGRARVGCNWYGIRTVVVPK